jgi:hypothetical protein
MAHKSQWWGIFFYPLAVLIVIGLYTLGASLFYLMQAVLSLSLVLVTLSVLGLLLAVGLFMIPWVFAWILEINADFKAINGLGIQAFSQIFYFLPKNKPMFYQKILIRLTHPPPGLTIRLWKRLHKSVRSVD